MTAAGLRESPRARAAGHGYRPTQAGLRLVRLHLASRRIPAALLALAGCGVLLRVSIALHWTLGSSSGAQQLPILIECGAAALIAVTTYSPLGEPERATGRWLPYLRLGTAVGLTAAAVGALAAGAAATHLPVGTLGIVRNVAGVTGIGLLLAAVLGSSLAWAGPMAYLVPAEFAVNNGWSTPWLWPGRPPLDRGAAICAFAVFAVGLAAITIRGARDSARE